MNVFLWDWFLYTFTVCRLGIYVYVHTTVVIRKENSPRESTRSYWRPLSFKNLHLPSLSKASTQCGSWIIHWNIRFLFVCIHLSLALLLSSPPYSLAYFATVFLFRLLLIRLWKRSIRKKAIILLSLFFLAHMAFIWPLGELWFPGPGALKPKIRSHVGLTLWAEEAEYKLCTLLAHVRVTMLTSSLGIHNSISYSVCVQRVIVLCVVWEWWGWPWAW